jgi:hypothetical protein
VVLEELLVSNNIGDVKELILTTACYIWWMRRQGMHDENVPPVIVAGMSIRAITDNNIRVLRKSLVKRKSSWIKPKETTLF